MREEERLIAAGHQCEVREGGYYWARLIIWEETPKAAAQRRFITHERRHEYPLLCNPSIVELRFTSEPEGKPYLVSGLGRKERLQDWLFLERIPPIRGYFPSLCSLNPNYASLLARPQAPGR